MKRQNWKKHIVQGSKSHRDQDFRHHWFKQEGINIVHFAICIPFHLRPNHRGTSSALVMYWLEIISFLLCTQGKWNWKYQNQHSLLIHHCPAGDYIQDKRRNIEDLNLDGTPALRYFHGVQDTALPQLWLKQKFHWQMARGCPAKKDGTLKVILLESW